MRLEARNRSFQVQRLSPAAVFTARARSRVQRCFLTSSIVHVDPSNWYRSSVWFKFSIGMRTSIFRAAKNAAPYAEEPFSLIMFKAGTQWFKPSRKPGEKYSLKFSGARVIAVYMPTCASSSKTSSGNTGVSYCAKYCESAPVDVNKIGFLVYCDNYLPSFSKSQLFQTEPTHTTGHPPYLFSSSGSISGVTARICSARRKPADQNGHQDIRKWFHFATHFGWNCSPCILCNSTGCRTVFTERQLEKRTEKLTCFVVEKTA